MIVERALSLAGPDAELVARPAGVPHVYVGRLTPSGRHVPRGRRTVCRAHTRRLSVLNRSERWSSLDPEATPVCARCSARLSRGWPGTGEPTPTTREKWRSRFAGLTRADVAAALLVAEDLEEVAGAAHLSLLLFGYAQLLEPFDERGRSWPPLHQLVAEARDRLAGDEERAQVAAFDEALIASNEQRRREAREIRAEREDRITRLGFVNATAHERPRRAPRRPRG